MNLFYRPQYASVATQFINQLKKDKPELDAQQREGRDLLWDKPVDREAWKSFREGQVDQQPYVYQTSGHQ